MQERADGIDFSPVGGWGTARKSSPTPAQEAGREDGRWSAEVGFLGLDDEGQDRGEVGMRRSPGGGVGSRRAGAWTRGEVAK